MLELALNEFKKLGFNKVYGQSSNGNVASAKVIENNGGLLLETINGSNYYEIRL